MNSKVVTTLGEVFARGLAIRCADCSEMLHSANEAMQHFMDMHGWKWVMGSGSVDG